MFFKTKIVKNDQINSVFDNFNVSNASNTLTFELLRQQIRELAYKKWEESGCPTGKDEEFWVAAEQELFGKMVEGGYQVRNNEGEYTIIKP